MPMMPPRSAPRGTKLACSIYRARASAVAVFLCAVLPIIVAGCASAVPGAQGPSIASVDAYEMSREGRVLIVDIRPHAERARDGAPAASVSVVFPAAFVADREQFVAEVSRVAGVDRARPLALLCRRGITSRAAQAVLANAGFRFVYNVSDGFLGNEAGPGWKGWGLPIVSPPNP